MDLIWDEEKCICGKPYTSMMELTLLKDDGTVTRRWTPFCKECGIKFKAGLMPEVWEIFK